jgi:hypothetical protein
LIGKSGGACREPVVVASLPITAHVAASERQRHLQSVTENLQSEIGLQGWRNWQTRQTWDCETVNFKTSLLVSKKNRLTGEDAIFHNWRRVCGTASKNVVIPVQFLVQMPSQEFSGFLSSVKPSISRPERSVH